MDEKLVGSLGEAASKVLESRGHVVKDSNMGVGNMFHGILGGIGGTTQLCIILQIILVLVYINCSVLLKFCQQKLLYLANQTNNSLINPLISTTTSPPKFTLPTESIRQPYTHTIFYPWHLQISLSIMLLHHKRSHTNNNFVSNWSHFMLSLDGYSLPSYTTL